MNQIQSNEATTPATDVKEPTSKSGLASAAETLPPLVNVDLFGKMDTWCRSQLSEHWADLSNGRPASAEPLKKELIQSRLLGYWAPRWG
jgi:hypothetical protein